LVTQTGLRYSLARVPMASTDCSTHAYSYDDTADDFALANFKLQIEDLIFKVS
jgi:glucosylceramidase